MRFLRYLSVTGVAYALDMGLFLVLIHGFDFAPVTANVIAKIVAAVFGYAAHSIITFDGRKDDPHLKQAIRYFSLVAVNVPLNSAALALLLLVIPYPEVAKFTADVIFVVINYWISRKAIFTRAS